MLLCSILDRIFSQRLQAGDQRVDLEFAKARLSKGALIVAN
jgi:hypothetical protein